MLIPLIDIRRTDDGQFLLTDLGTWYIGYNAYDPTQEVPDKFLPLISPRSSELKPGKYRVKPEGILDERGDYVRQGHYISGIRLRYSGEEEYIQVIIEFTSDTPELKLNWGADSDEAIRPGDEIVVEILRKRDVRTYHIVGRSSTIPATDHIYEARPIRNLSRPEVVFEFVEFEEEEADGVDMAADAAE